MSVGLRRLRDDELAAYREASEQGYAESIEVHGGVPRGTAVEKARLDFEALWPDGRPAPGQDVYAVEEDGVGTGFLWLTERENHGRKVAWIYDVEIAASNRGRGLGREAMKLAEEETRARGISRLELNVFGGNEVARNLDRSLGYEENAVLMGRNLA